MKVYLVNESIEGSDAVVKVFSTEEAADKFAEKLLAELLAEFDVDDDAFGVYVYVVEMEVE